MWKTISTTEIFRHPRIVLVEDEVLLPNGKQIQYLKFAGGQDAVTVIAKNQQGKFCISTEYSYPPNAELYQFPGGGVEDGETPEMAAQRELREEVGCKAEQLQFLGKYLVNNRRSSQYMHVFLATDLTEASLPGDAEEDIINEWIASSELNDKILRGEIVNVHMLAAWMLYTTNHLSY
jgi:ADP-ribose pyrophosphatase